MQDRAIVLMRLRCGFSSLCCCFAVVDAVDSVNSLYLVLADAPALSLCQVIQTNMNNDNNISIYKVQPRRN